MKKAQSLGILGRVVLGLLAVALVMSFTPSALRAEVTRVEITSKQDVLGGKSFGAAGAYEKLTGKVYFAVDPNNPHNKIIADLDKAPKNAQGKVEFSADIFIVRPKDASKGNGALIFDIPNRGNKGALSAFNRAKGSADPTTEEEFGDGLLMRQGYTVVAIGWEFDIPKKPGLVLLTAPVATDNGKPITGWLPTEPWFIPNKQADSYNYASADFTPSYPPLDPKNPEYRLTERPGIVTFPRLIPREDWQFGKMENGQLVPDVNWVTMKGGFKPGKVYQLAYETSNPPVAGVGFAAVRDLASSIKYSTDAIVHGNYIYTFGSSQVGRWQRQMIYEGFTIDEQGRKAIDALFIQTGGTGLGSFNERWAQPDELGSYTQTKFPIRYEMTTDPITGKRDGLGARIPAGLEPKIMLVDTESEYYDRGRVDSLRHTSMDGGTDLARSAEYAHFPSRRSEARLRLMASGAGAFAAAPGRSAGIPLCAARLAGGSRRLGEKRRRASAQPASHRGRSHRGAANRAPVSQRPRRAVADPRARRIPQRSACRAHFGAAFPAAASG